MLSNIKKGDHVQHKISIGIKVWNGIYFKRDFIVHDEVERVTPTQFVANGVRYKKATGMEITSSCKCRKAELCSASDQSGEAEAYQKEIYEASRLIRLYDSSSDYSLYSCKTLDDIKSACELLDEVRLLAPKKKRYTGG